MWIPPNVSDKLRAEREEYEHTLRTQVAAGEMLKSKRFMDEFNYELKRIDDKLELIRAPRNCGDTGMKPLYYHVIRWNEGAPPTFMVIEGEHGEFVEPTARVFEMLKRSDLWDPANMRRLREKQSRADAAGAKIRERENAQRREHLSELYNAATRTQVSMNFDTPWTQNNSPASRRSRAARSKAKKAA